MSDTVEDLVFNARQLLNKGKTHPLRERMREFVSKHGSTADFKELRGRAAEGKKISELVKEDREERF